MDDTEFLTVKSGVALPALQAAVSGFFWGGCFAGLVAVANSLELLSIPAWAVGVTVGSLAALRAWGNLLDDWRGAMYSGSKYYEPEAQEPVIIPPVRVELASNNGNRVEFLDLPAQPEQLISLGSGLVQGASMTESAWIGRGKPFTRGEFVSLRDELIRRGLARWVSPGAPSRGVEISGKGFAVMRHFSSMSSSPTLHLEQYR